MPETSNLASRIDAEFTDHDERHKKAQTEQVHAYQERRNRLQKLTQVFDQLREIWRPRLQLLTDKFDNHVEVTPRIVPSTREVTFEFQSKVARIRLRFAATTDRDITRVILTDDLSIIPSMMSYDAHSELAFPLDAVDVELATRWMDDRIISFVKTYLALHDNEQYMKDDMVEDPIANIRFPKYAAGATLEWQGQTYYFVGEETRTEFMQQKKIASK
jgi:YHS domain-containing protein